MPLREECRVHPWTDLQSSIINDSGEPEEVRKLCEKGIQSFEGAFFY